MESQGGSRTFPEIRESGENDFLGGFGGNGPAQKRPGYHTIHFGLTESPQTPWGTLSSAKPSFVGPHVWLKKVPGPAGNLWGPNLGYWVAKMSLGVENIKVAH